MIRFGIMPRLFLILAYLVLTIGLFVYFLEISFFIFFSCLFFLIFFYYTLISLYVSDANKLID